MVVGKEVMRCVMGRKPKAYGDPRCRKQSRGCLRGWCRWACACARVSPTPEVPYAHFNDPYLCLITAMGKARMGIIKQGNHVVTSLNDYHNL